MYWKEFSMKKKRFLIGGLVSLPYSIWVSVPTIGCIKAPSIGCGYLLFYNFFALLLSTPFYWILGDPSVAAKLLIQLPLTFIANFLVLGLVVMLGGYVWDRIKH